MDPITITFPGFKRLLGCQSFEDPPSSSDSVIVFPWNSSHQKFDRKFYSSDLTQGRASSDDINQVLTLFELIFPRIPSSSIFLTSWTLRFLFPMIVMILFELNRVFRNSDFAWSLLSIYWVVGLIHLFSERYEKREQAKAELEEVLKMVQPAYIKRGLRWRVPEELGGWIELMKDENGSEQLSILIVKPDECVEGDSQYVALQDIKE